MDVCNRIDAVLGCPWHLGVPDVFSDVSLMDARLEPGSDSQVFLRSTSSSWRTRGDSVKRSG